MVCVLEVSIAANMLTADYGKGDNHSVFSDRKLAQCGDWDRYLNQFDVVKIVMTDFIKRNKDVEGSLVKMADRILTDLTEAYSDVRYDPED